MDPIPSAEHNGRLTKPLTKQAETDVQRENGEAKRVHMVRTTASSISKFEQIKRAEVVFCRAIAKSANLGFEKQRAARSGRNSHDGLRV